MQPALETIATCRAKLCIAVQNGYEYERVIQSQLNALLDPLVARGSINPKTGAIEKPFEPSREGMVLMLYQCASSYRDLLMLCATKQIALVHFLNTAIDSIVVGNLVAGLTCFRSVIEHVAHFDWTMGQIKFDLTPKSYKEANETLWKLHGVIVKAPRSTRFDWEKLRNVNDIEAFERLKVEYKSTETRLDLFVKSILTPIDGLAKHIKGIRNVYELLCEFAHPNVGVRFAFVQSAEPFIDHQSVGWVREQIKLGLRLASCGVWERFFPYSFRRLPTVLNTSISYW